MVVCKNEIFQKKYRIIVQVRINPQPHENKNNARSFCCSFGENIDFLEYV